MNLKFSIQYKIIKNNKYFDIISIDLKHRKNEKHTARNNFNFDKFCMNFLSIADEYTRIY